MTIDQPPVPRSRSRWIGTKLWGDLVETFKQGPYADRLEYLTAVFPDPTMPLTDPAVQEYVNNYALSLGYQKLAPLINREAGLRMLEISDQEDVIAAKIKALKLEIRKLEAEDDILSEEFRKYTDLAYGKERGAFPMNIGIIRWTKQQLEK